MANNYHPYKRRSGINCIMIYMYIWEKLFLNILTKHIMKTFIESMISEDSTQDSYVTVTGIS